ncbi:hypothetical protein DNK57_05735 [Methanothermobacter thermautotrophicus]|uniref:CRISPR-associated protein Cas5 n=1 Tax=Methanothermobacter thermautotrophicus TaxID=145262 RepID=A0A842YQB2_METTF|nr:CRISPR-associated protein Cas5 [Methanothermobacter thermautotrophicus]MBE2900304.1 hypothetical protein [Methanothermobacter thermautotrophicus]
MEAVRFIIEGLINSFRIPQTSVYQLTYLAPTKTQVVGMLTNIMGKNEGDYYALLDKLRIGIVPLYINSIFNDAWTFKKWKSSGAGRDILQRERIYMGKFLIYVVTEDSNLLGEIMDYLMCPSRVPSLGMDDELVIIREPKRITMESRKSETVHSLFTLEEGMNFKYHPLTTEISNLFPPRIISVNLNFNKNVTPRKPTRFVQIVEFAGLSCELNRNKDLYFDKERQYNIEFL